MYPKRVDTLLSSCMSTICTFRDTIIPYRTESVRFLVLMDSATKPT